MAETSMSGAASIGADTAEFERSMERMSQAAERFGETFSASLRRAMLSGRELDDAVAGIALRLSNLALEQAMAPVDQLAGALASALAGGAGRSTAGSIVFNVNSPDAAGITKSSGQIAALLQRLVVSGGRGL